MTAASPYVGDHRVRFPCRACIVNQHSRARRPERQCGGAANAARSSGDQSGLSIQIHRISLRLFYRRTSHASGRLVERPEALFKKRSGVRSAVYG
jgi:hypothetical protein